MTLMKYSFRSRTSDSPVCHCGKADESVEHFLLHCKNTVKDRMVMIDTVKDLAVSKNSKRSLRITEDYQDPLLAPTYDDVSKRDML